MEYKNSFNNATEAFEYFYDYILANGRETNVGTKALYNVGFTIEHPEDFIITTPWRKFSLTYANREWDWYMSRNCSVEELEKYAPTWKHMHSPGDYIVNSNYGWQWSRNDQLNKVIDMLKKNPNTRQAVVTIYDGKEIDMYKYDTCCTLNIGFQIVDNKLNMSVIMRSNDLWYGFCNDQVQFYRLQKMVADAVGIETGTYYHFAIDLHIYNEQANKKVQ